MNQLQQEWYKQTKKKKLNQNDIKQNSLNKRP